MKTFTEYEEQPILEQGEKRKFFDFGTCTVELFKLDNKYGAISSNNIHEFYADITLKLKQKGFEGNWTIMTKYIGNKYIKLNYKTNEMMIIIDKE